MTMDMAFFICLELLIRIFLVSKVVDVVIEAENVFLRDKLLGEVEQFRPF